MKNCKYYRQIQIYQSGVRMEKCAKDGETSLIPTTRALCKFCKDRIEEDDEYDYSKMRY